MQGFAPKGVHGTTSSLSSSCELMFTVFHGEDLQLNYIAAFFSMSKGLQIILFSDFETLIQQFICHCGPSQDRSSIPQFCFEATKSGYSKKCICHYYLPHRSFNIRLQ